MPVEQVDLAKWSEAMVNPVVPAEDDVPISAINSLSIYLEDAWKQLHGVANGYGASTQLVDANKKHSLNLQLWVKDLLNIRSSGKTDPSGIEWFPQEVEGFVDEKMLHLQGDSWNKTKTIMIATLPKMPYFSAFVQQIELTLPMAQSERGDLKYEVVFDVNRFSRNYQAEPLTVADALIQKFIRTEQFTDPEGQATSVDRDSGLVFHL
jgi:hypothetical protein